MNFFVFLKSNPRNMIYPHKPESAHKKSHTNFPAETCIGSKVKASWKHFKSTNSATS